MRIHQALLSFSMPFCLIILTINTDAAPATTSHCLNHQQFLLLNLKDNLIYNPASSKKMVHWNQSGDCCQWNGVTCNMGHVVGLDLSEEFISGGLNNSNLFNLQYLQNLSLAYNNFSSSIPSKIGMLKNLRYLNLSNADFQGLIPIEIFHLTSLAILDFSNQDLNGVLPNFLLDVSLHTLNLSNTNLSGKLPSSLSNLKQLSTLDLSNCRFNGTLPLSLSTFTRLVHLDLSFNNFIGTLPSFRMSKQLRYLSLLHNNLTGSISSADLEGLVNLITINLGDNSLNGKIPPSVLTLPSLQDLTLSHNGFAGPLDEFPNASSSKLQLVDLSSNEIQGPVPVSIFQLKELRFLQLSGNKFNGSMRLDMIQRLQSLNTLGLSYNNLSVDITFKENHDGLPSFPKMKYLLLASCKLKEFPKFLRNQPRLNGLDLSNNYIHGAIPNWILRFDSLVYLNLSNNFFTNLEGPFDDLNSNLYSLDLHSNKLVGKIPTFTKYAVHLDYSSNKFSTVPPDIDMYLPFVYFLSLSNNSFQGNIHKSFCNFSSLRLLDLSRNGFSGFIPKCLTKRNSILRVLNLAGNKLTGYVSDTISSSCNLRFLDLNGNNFRGVIPKSLTNCQRLQVLNLGNNMFSGRFPCFLRKISTLRVLILRSNKFYGPISCPTRTNDWEMLHIVDLASNNFTGTLPKSLLRSWTKMMGGNDRDEIHEEYGTLFFDMFDNHDTIRYNKLFLVINKFLVKRLGKLLSAVPYDVADHLFDYYVSANEFGGRYLDSVTIVNKGMQMKLIKIPTIFTSIDLSSNHFEGPIPEEIVNLRALNDLNLSHNTFTSHIPLSFGNLMHLESLDMSNNNLSGEIPNELASLTFLSYLNLSYNHLVGEIPIGTQMQTFDAISFEGNEGLCGPPLTNNCDDGGKGLWSSQALMETNSSTDWNILSGELGFTFGLGCVIIPLILWKRWRLWYSMHVDGMLYKIFPQLDFVYERGEGGNYRTLRWISR